MSAILYHYEKQKATEKYCCFYKRFCQLCSLQYLDMLELGILFVQSGYLQ